MDELEDLVGSPEFAAVKAGVVALNPLLLVDRVLGPQLLALRTGLLGLEGAMAMLVNEPPGEGDPGAGEPGEGDPGAGEPGAGEPGAGEPGEGEPGAGEPGEGEPGEGEPVTDG